MKKNRFLFLYVTFLLCGLFANQLDAMKCMRADDANLIFVPFSFVAKIFIVSANEWLLGGAKSLPNNIPVILSLGGSGIFVKWVECVCKMERLFDKRVSREIVSYVGRNCIASSLLGCVDAELPPRHVLIKSAILSGLGVGILSLWKRFSVAELLHTIGNTAAYFSMLETFYILNENNEPKSRPLKFAACYAGIACACLSQDDVSWFGRKVGLNICDQHKKFKKFSYLPNEGVNYWKDRDINDGEEKVSIERGLLEELHGEAEKNRLRRTPFILRSLYGIKNMILGRKQTIIERILHAQGKLQSTLENTLEKKGLPAEIRAHIFGHCEGDKRFAFDKKKKTFKKLDKNELLTVSKAVLRREVVPYLQSDDWYIKNKSTINIKFDKDIKPLEIAKLGFS